MPQNSRHAFLLIRINLFPPAGDLFTDLTVYLATSLCRTGSSYQETKEHDRMRRAISFAADLAFFACMSFSLIAQETPAAPQEHHAMPKPTNLQVLPKDIAPQDLMKMMVGFLQALGVRCNFCH